MVMYFQITIHNLYSLILTELYEYFFDAHLENVFGKFVSINIHTF